MNFFNLLHKFIKDILDNKVRTQQIRKTFCYSKSLL